MVFFVGPARYFFVCVNSFLEHLVLCSKFARLLFMSLSTYWREIWERIAESGTAQYSHEMPPLVVSVQTKLKLFCLLATQ